MLGIGILRGSGRIRYVYGELCEETAVRIHEIVTQQPCKEEESSKSELPERPELAMAPFPRCMPPPSQRSGDKHHRELNS